LAIGVPKLSEPSNLDITPYSEAIGHKLLDDLRIRLDKNVEQVDFRATKDHLKLVKRTSYLNEKTPTNT
jgi:hypothetical protein